MILFFTEVRDQRLEEIREAIGYGVIKMNIDTDLQFAFTEGARDYILSKTRLIATQIGNPDGESNRIKNITTLENGLREGEITL